MGEGTQQIDEGEHHERDELAHALEEREHAIVETWLGRICGAAEKAHATVTELRDGIGDYITRIAELLRSEKPLAGHSAEAWTDVAKEHAITRVQLGFDIKQLVRELVALRETIVDELRDTRLLENKRNSERITVLIDAALAESLKSYVDSRDFEARREEAEHIGFVTHELRNPLATAILAAAHLRSVDDPGQRTLLLDALERSLDRLRRLVDDTLLSERLQAGKVEPRPVDMSLGQLLSEPVANATRAAHEKGIDLVATYDPALRLHVDPKLMLTVLENLLDNAVKYTDKGVVELAIVEHAEELIVHVRDNCDGLSREELAVIFEPFRRAHASKPGTGLGLAIARRAIEAQGGTIGAESSSERGCHFWFTLPKLQH